ncbi:unnamed protein product, partial [Durusdinium trenchii]
ALSVSEPGDVDESGEEATLTVSSNESASPTHISQFTDQTGGESGESDGKEAALALTAAELEDQFDSQIDREKHPELASILDQINAECREGQAAKTDSVDGLTPEQYHITLAEHFLRPDVPAGYAASAESMWANPPSPLPIVNVCVRLETCALDFTHVLDAAWKKRKGPPSESKHAKESKSDPTVAEAPGHM